MSSLFDIIVMSEFFKLAKCTKFVRNWVSYKNHPKFDILVMSEFFKIAKCTKFVRNCVSYNIHWCFWCNAAEFTKKIKDPIVFWLLVGDPSMGTLIFFVNSMALHQKHQCIVWFFFLRFFFNLDLGGTGLLLSVKKAFMSSVWHFCCTFSPPFFPLLQEGMRSNLGEKL